MTVQQPVQQQLQRIIRQQQQQQLVHGFGIRGLHVYTQVLRGPFVSLQFYRAVSQRIMISFLFFLAPTIIQFSKRNPSHRILSTRYLHDDPTSPDREATTLNHVNGGEFWPVLERLAYAMQQHILRLYSAHQMDSARELRSAIFCGARLLRYCP